MLCYLAKEYEREFYSSDIYGKRLVKIPAPEMYVFYYVGNIVSIFPEYQQSLPLQRKRRSRLCYNGKEEVPLEQELKLSDAFFEKRDKLYVEAIVRVINVNYEKGARLLEKCKLLREYSILIHKIRLRCRQGMELRDAISISVQECVKEGILAEFLKRNGGEIMSFLFQELSREECEAIREQDGYIRGLEDGERRGLQIGKEDQQRFSAEKLKAMDMPAADISEVTGLSIDEIEAL